MVGLQVAFFYYQVGTSGFLHSFFSTVCVRLEDGQWGARFPALMDHLYQGRIPADRVPEALEELGTISAELARHPPSEVVWDIDDPGTEPPWGSDISPEIADLSEYFVTSDGEDLITIMRHALEKASETGEDVVVRVL